VARAQDPTDDTVSVDVPVSIFVGVAYNGTIRMADLAGTPVEGVAVSYETASTVSDEAGAFSLPVPDEAGVTPLLSKRGWSFTLVSTETGPSGIIYRYSAVPALEARSYAVWDASTPGTSHVLKLLNKGAATQTPTVTLYSRDGSVCGAPGVAPIAPMSASRIPLSASPCLALGTAGIIEVSNTQPYDGEFESLVPRGDDVDIRTSGSLPLMNGLFGPSYVTFDTGAAVVDDKLDRRLVENALIIGNLSDQTATFRVKYTRASGSHLRTQRVTVPSQGISRIVVGAPDQKRAISGLVEIAPESDTVEYVAAMRRYGYQIVLNEKTNELEKGRTFYSNSEPARVGDGKRYVARFDYASPMDGENFLEFANTTTKPTTVAIVHLGLEVKRSDKLDKDGKRIPPKTVSKRTTFRITVPSLGTRRVKFSRFIKTSKEGTVSIVSDKADAVLTNVVAHTYTSRGLLRASKLSMVPPSYGDELYGFYESAPPSTVLISNMASTEVSATVSCFVGGSLVNAVPLSIKAGRSVSTRMATCFKGNNAGLIQVNSSRAGALGVDRVEFRKPSGSKLRSRLR
jgi:hypothetical protein